MALVADTAVGAARLTRPGREPACPNVGTCDGWSPTRIMPTSTLLDEAAHNRELPCREPVADFRADEL